VVSSPYYVNSTIIVFAVPNGVYNYNLTASGWNFSNPSGTVNVEGDDVIVILHGPEISCTTTIVTTG